MTVVPLEFRKALGHFVTGVTVVTTRCAMGTPQGITANSFTSVSLDPPLVSVNLSRTLASFQHFRSCRAFAVHLLGADQQSTSSRFAAHGTDKWSELDYGRGIMGVPILPDRLGVFVCSFYASYEAGDHEILIGKVENFEINTDAEPLAFFKGNYHGVIETSKNQRSSVAVS